MIAGLILAAGRSRRFKGEGLKQFASLLGQPVVNYSIDRFEEEKRLDTYLLVVPPGCREKAASLIALETRSKLLGIRSGGATRRESVKKGLEELAGQSPDSVLVQDAARPGVPPSVIKSVLDRLESGDFRGVVPSLPVRDTIKRMDPEQRDQVAETLNRSELRRAQTPQAFDFSVLKSVHETWSDSREVTDDAMMLEVQNYPVGFTDGSLLSKKVTRVKDLTILRSLLQEVSD